MKVLENIPKIWTRAYFLICLWYALNFALSAFFEWKLFRPFPYVLWGGFFLFEALCLLILLIFLYSHWLSRFKLYYQVAGHSVGIVAFFYIMGTLSWYFTDYLDGLVFYDNWRDYLVGLLSWDALRFNDQYIITAGVYYVIRYFQELQRQDKEKSELALRNKEMQISLLKSQINPHFLFNTLNSISTLMNSSKDQARKMITQLGDVFRYALDSHKTENVELKSEVQFIESYLKIQKVRFGDRLRFHKEIEPNCLSMRIPPMILQPLIENSVKYGIAPKEVGGTIYLTVKQDGQKVFFEVRDDGMGSKAEKVMDSGGSGVGMANTEMRLKSYYGQDAKLRIKKSDQGYSVSFWIESLAVPTNDQVVDEVYHY
jgi:two-component system, LytTR family, sensor kinase